MLNFYLGFNFEISYEFGYKAVSLVDVLILVLKLISVIDISFSGIILEESSNNFQEVSFIPSISFSIYYQVFQEGCQIFPDLF